MTNSAQPKSWTLNLRPATAALVIVLAVVVTQSVHAQTFTVLHNFAAGADGATPSAGLSMDKAGNLYGTTVYGGAGCPQQSDNGCGMVFRLLRRGASWIYTPLYSFEGWNSHDGSYPSSRAIVGPDGSLYGLTTTGGRQPACDGNQGCGTVYNLKPSPTRPASVLSPWVETVLYRFQPDPDGKFPIGEIAFDRAGNLYGTTHEGGTYDPWGTIFELSPSGNSWTEQILYNFKQQLDGGQPTSGVVLDHAGSLYGTAELGGTLDDGVIFQLAASGSGWTLNNLHSFGGPGDALGAYGGVIFDPSGNFYGGAENGNLDGGAPIYEMSPSDGGWTYSQIYSFYESYGGGPAASLAMDAAGSLYGTTRGTSFTNNPHGSVFKLTPSNGGWTYTDLHDFTGGSDGGTPYSNVVIDSIGNLYGTTTVGGTGSACKGGCGIVWEITP